MNLSIKSFLPKLSNTAIVSAVICSTAYLLMLGFYNNLLLDDYGFVAEVDEGGAYGLMHSAYFGWQSRFSAFYVLGWILKIWGHSSNLLGYTIFLLMLGYGAVYYALRNITRLDNRWTLWGCAILITNISIFAYFEFSTFYWVCCLLYTLSTYAAIVLFTAVFFSRGALWARWLTVILCSLYICGGAENFTPIIIASLGIIMLYQMVVNRTWQIWRTSQQQMILVSLLILSIGFLVVVMGPGTHSRAEDMTGFMGHFSLSSYCYKLVAASSVFLMRLFSRTLYYVLLLPIGYVIGKQMNIDLYANGIRKHLLLSLCVLIFVIILSIAAPVFGMGWYSPLRSYSFVSFVMSIWFVFLGVICGSKYSEQTVDCLLIVSACFIITYSIYYYRKEQPLVKDYNEQIVACKTAILGQIDAERTDPLILQPVTHPVIPNTYAILRSSINRCLGKKNTSIAPPATYFPYEQFGLSKDPYNWKNEDLKQYYNTQFDIIGWENPD